MTPSEIVQKYYELAISGDNAQINAHLEENCAPGVRICIPQRLPYGGTVTGIHDAIERLYQVRSFQFETINEEYLVDDPVIIHFGEVSWRQDSFARRGVANVPAMPCAEWWYFSEGQVAEVHFFLFDLGLVPLAGSRVLDPPSDLQDPEKGLIGPGHILYGRNRATNPSQALVERIYNAAKEEDDSIWEQVFDEASILYESDGLPYGSGSHHGLVEMTKTISEVAVWCDMQNIQLRAVVSEGEHVAALCSSGLRGGTARVPIFEDWHVKNGKVDWYRAYYWDTDSIARVYSKFSSQPSP